MDQIYELLAITLGAILSNNFIFSQFLGCCPFLGVSKKVDTAVGMGIAVTFVMGLASAACYAVNLLLLHLDLAYMQTVAFILVIAALVQFIEMFLQKAMPALYTALGIYLPLITTNCAVLGVCISNVDSYLVEGAAFGISFVHALFNSFGSGLGFFLAMVLFAGVRTRVERCNCPECFKGMPITLLSASILSVSFMGFAGLVENLLG